VVVTARTVGSSLRTWVYVIDLSGPTPTIYSGFELDAGQPLAQHAPHDVAITPNDRLAVVTASDEVALIDISLTPPQLIGEHVTTIGFNRSYLYQADSLEVTNSQAVAIGALGASSGTPGTGWQADVYDISSSGLALKKSELGVEAGYPHDLALNEAGQKAVFRTAGAGPVGSIVVLSGIDQAASQVVRTDLPSPSFSLSRLQDNQDSVVSSSSWVVHVQSGSGLRQYAVSYAYEGTRSRLDFVDLAASVPAIVHTEYQEDSSYNNVVPTSIAIARLGLAVVLRCKAFPAAPSEVPANYDLSTGEDVWFYALNPIQKELQWEMWANPLASSDPMDVKRFRAVNVSTYVAGNTSFVHTIGFQ
jgi:hypothetical protein